MYRTLFPNVSVVTQCKSDVLGLINISAKILATWIHLYGRAHYIYFSNSLQQCIHNLYTFHITWLHRVNTHMNIFLYCVIMPMYVACPRSADTKRNGCSCLYDSTCIVMLCTYYVLLSVVLPLYVILFRKNI